MCDLDLQPTQTNVSNGTTSSQEEHLCKIILKSMNKWRHYGPEKLNLRPFCHLILKCDLDLQPTKTNVSNSTTTPQGKHMCKIILKSMHKCWSYGPDKLIYMTFKCNLDLQPTEKNVSNGTSPPQGQQLCQIILQSINNVGVMDQTNLEGCTHTHAHTYTLAK